jgi:hypothetical protein
LRLTLHVSRRRGGGELKRERVTRLRVERSAAVAPAVTVRTFREAEFFARQLGVWKRSGSTDAVAGRRFIGREEGGGTRCYKLEDRGLDPDEVNEFFN